MSGAGGTFQAEEEGRLVKTAVGPTILLRGGTYFDLLDPEGSHFTIHDIAHGLSHVCRFAGQCRRFYSVAEHSVHVSRIVTSEHALAGLLHDASEAFIGDVTRPLKRLLPEYRAIEERIERTIFGRFGVPFPLPGEVKDADIRMLAAEQDQIMGRAGDVWPACEGVDAAPVKIDCWEPYAAVIAFLDRFYMLSGGRHD